MKLKLLQAIFVLALFASPGMLLAQTPMYSYNVGTLANLFPFQTTSSNRVQWLYTPANFPTAPAGNITAIYVKVATGNTNITYYNFKISLGTTAASNLGTNGLTYPWNTGLNTVINAPLSYAVPVAVANGWVQFNLTTPWYYNATSNFILEISDTAYVGGFTVIQDYNINGARLYGAYNAAVGTANTGLLDMGFDIAAGCVGTPNVPTISTAPIAPPGICIGSTTSISASAIGGPGISYQWQQAPTATGPWTNVSGGTGATTLTYTTPPMSATTWYQLVVLCANSNQSSYSVAFQVPVANPQITNVTPGGRCGPGTVVLGAAGSGNTSFNWYTSATGGSPIGTGNSFTTPIISTTTTYYVSATGGSCEGATRTPVTATINPLPVIGSYSSTNPTICFGSNGTITINGLTPATVYSLSYKKNGNPIGPLNITTNATGQYVITGLTIGTYTQINVTLVSTGCQGDTLSPIVLVQPIIVPTPTVNNNGPICAGATLNLTATTTPGSTYSWTGPSYSSTQQNPSITNAQTTNAGTYSVIATYQGCISNAGTTTVVVHPLPTAVITAAGSTNICAGSTVQLNANTGTGLTYHWRLNTAQIPGAIANNYNAGAAGTYTCTVTSSFGCNSLSNPLTVAVKPVPTPAISHTGPLSFCEGNSVVLTGSTDPNTPTYQWYKNTTQINGASTTSYTVFQSGTYTYRITNDFGCTGVSAGTVVTVYPVLNPIISRNNNILSTTPYISYQWYYNNVAIPGATGPGITMTGNGFYEVEGTDANGCKSKSAIAWIQNLGVNGAGANAADVKIYPNPASDVIHIEAPIAVNMAIRNVHGQLVMSQDNATVVNISLLADGVYSVVLTDKNGQLIKTEKLVKMN
jgi:hypothetical protein